MANAYVGNPYALVFPVDCDGFLKIPYGRNAGVGTFTANTTTQTFTANTSSNTTLSSVSSFTGLIAGMRITGSGIPSDTFIVSLDSSANTMIISNAATESTNGVTISFGRTLSNVSSSSFTGLDVGMPITGSGIPDNTAILSLDSSANTITISRVITATATGVTISFGSHTDITETDLWSHGAGFTVEAVITPYDVNGNGQTGKGKVQENTGISVGTFTATTSSNTTLSSVSSFTGLGIGMPITGTGIPNNTIIVSLDTSANTITISNAATASASGVTISFGDYANGITDRYAQKMMLFSNTSFQFYLENQTTGNVNQPAEYRLAAKVGSTTLNSPTVIKPVNTLHGYYDANGFYNGMRTSLTQINTNASISLEQGSVEITGNLSGLANVKATGNLTLGSIPSGELYTAGTKRTVDITMAGLPSIADGTLDSSNTFAAGSVEIDSVSKSTIGSYDTTKRLTIPSTSSLSLNFYFFDHSSDTNVANNGRPLTTTFFGDEDTLHSSYSGTDIAVISANNTSAGFAAALNAAINLNNNASLHSGNFDIDSQVDSGNTSKVNLTADTIGTAYNQNIVKGGAHTMTVTGFTGGATATIVEQYLTITMKTGSSSTVPKNFKYFASGNNGTATTTPADVTVYRVVVGNDTDATADNLVSAINIAFANTEAVASKSATNVVRVEQQYVGSGFGSGSSVSETSAYNSDTLHTIGSFTSGAQASDASYNEYIKIGTNFFSPCDDASLAGTTKTITGDSGSATSRLFLGDSALANNVNSLVAQINTDVSSNGSSIITGSNTSTGVISFQLNDFTAALAVTKTLTNVSVTSITGGQDLSAFISITDAAGLVKKYKPSTIENTGATDGTYVFFQASSDTAATAAQLELAIEHANGHNGSLTVNTSSSTLTLTVTTGGTSETMSADGSHIISSGGSANVTLTAFSGAPNVINVSASQNGLLGAGNKIYDSNGTFVDTVASVNGTAITLSNPQSSITSTIYKEQPKEALYVNNLYKVSCVLEKSGKLKLFFNNTLVAETAISSFTFDMANADCFIGQDGTNVSTQFMGELYEIAMKKGAQPSPSLHTLDPGYSDIIFYYRFGDE